MMGSRSNSPDPALSGMNLSQFLELAADPQGFAAKLAQIRESIEEMARQQSMLKAVRTEHDTREASLAHRARELDIRDEALRERENTCVSSEAETGRRQQEQDARAASLAQQSAAVERRQQLVTEQRAELKQAVRRAAQAIDALNKTVEG